MKSLKKVGNLGCFIDYIGKFRIFFKNLRKLGKLGKLGLVGALFMYGILDAGSEVMIM